jgi:flavin reductase (DIM6/NTAB) family NADH-FMN oxidoreductase RutF
MNENAKRLALRRIPYGMFLMAANGAGGPVASTLTWLSQCSFHPPLVMIGVQSNSLVHEAIAETGAVGISFLVAGQQDVAERFFRPASPEKGRLHGLAFETGPETAAPVFTELPAWIEGRVTGRVDGGDHTVFVCEVVGAEVRDPAFEPLLLSSTPWNYGG